MGPEDTPKPKMRVPILLAAAALCGFPLVSGRQSAAALATQPSVAVPEDGASLALLDFGGRAVVDMKINGQGPFRFVLGSAATISILDTSLLQEASLTRAEGQRAATAGGQPAALYRIDELRAGGLVLRNITAAVMPLKNFASGASQPRGILSAAIFQSCLLTYDYPGHRVFIERGRLAAADAQATFQYSPGLPVLPIRIAGMEWSARLDTGSSDGLTLPSRFLQELALASPPKSAGKMRTIAGDFALSRARIKSPIEIGRYTIDAGEVYFSDVMPGSAPGILGYQVLQHFAVTIDPQNRRIRLAQPSRRE